MTWKSADCEIDVTEAGVTVTSVRGERRFPLTPSAVGVGKWTTGGGSALVLGEKKLVVIGARGVAYHYETRLPVQRVDVTLPKHRFEELVCALQQRWRAKHTRNYRVTGDVRAPLQKYFDLYRIPAIPLLLLAPLLLSSLSPLGAAGCLALIAALRSWALRKPWHRLRVSDGAITLLRRGKPIATAQLRDLAIVRGIACSTLTFPSGRALRLDDFEDRVGEPIGWPFLRLGIRRSELPQLHAAIREALSSPPCAASRR